MGVPSESGRAEASPPEISRDDLTIVYIPDEYVDRAVAFIRAMAASR